MIERNGNVPVNGRPYLSIKDKFNILEKKALNMHAIVNDSTKESMVLKMSIGELVGIIDSTPSIFHQNAMEEIKNKEDQINKNTIHQNNENSRSGIIALNLLKRAIDVD